MRRVLVFAPLVLGALAIALHGWDRVHAVLLDRRPAPTPARPVSDAPNVLLLVLDTVRAELHGGQPQ